MRRLLMGTFVLISVLTLTIGVSRAIGHAQPTRPEIALLHLGDSCALPCWIGITPGKTTFEEAIQRIKGVWGSLPDFVLECGIGGCEFGSKSGDLCIRIQLTGNSGTIEVGMAVTWVEFSQCSEYSVTWSINLGQLFDVIGTPQHLMIAPSDTSSDKFFGRLLYDKYATYTYTNDSYQLTIDIGQLVNTIQLSDQMRIDPDWYHTWRGFGRAYTEIRP